MTTNKEEPKKEQTELQRQYKTPKDDSEILAYISLGMEEYI